jgi:glycerophosphoryl diester phosphodiesterase
MIKLDNTDLFTKPIAHRGFWDENNPENTMGAFKRAAEKGYGIELDVQFSSDNQVIVFHDEYLDRLTNITGPVLKQTYSTIKEQKILNSDYTVPLFKEVLEEIDGKVPLLIEIKNTENIKLLCDSIVKLLIDYKGEFAVQSFNPYIIKYLYDTYPVIIRGQLAAFNYGDEVSAFRAFLLKRMMFNHITMPHFVSYYVENLPNKYVDKCKKRKIAVLAWTVRSQHIYDKIKSYVDNIIFEGFEPK